MGSVSFGIPACLSLETPNEVNEVITSDREPDSQLYDPQDWCCVSGRGLYSVRSVCCQIILSTESSDRATVSLFCVVVMSLPVGVAQCFENGLFMR
ncbi:uncharacterized, partial [Tachysurus ichikawai]